MSQKALICDFDGTLFNAWDWMVVTAQKVLHEFRIGMSRRDIEKYFTQGTHLEEFYRVCVREEKEVQEMITRHREIQNHPDMMATVVPYPGVPETITQLHEQGVRLGIATSRGSRGDLIQTLQTHNLLRQFDSVVCLEDVENSKPDPECVFKAMETWRVDPEDTFFVGDTVSDIKAGRAAGVTTIGALYGFGDDNMVKSKPDYLIDSFDKVVPIVLS